MAYRRYKIAEQLEYANHSPISKKLAQIRHQAAEQFFGLVFVAVSITAMAGIPAQHAGTASGS